MTPPVLEIDGVSKDFRGLRPLRLERLSVAKGERVAIVGMDHVSAEVFINLVTGATLPDAGRIELFGRSTADISDSADWLGVVDRFGIVSERAVLLEPLTVLQNLAMPFTLEIEPPPEDVRSRAAELARDAGLAETTWTMAVGAVDPADRARIRLGRALALNPAILLIEHISAGLTPDAASALGRDVRHAATERGAALIALTADAAFARIVGDRVLTWQPATGRLDDSRRTGWFGRRLG